MQSNAYEKAIGPLTRAIDLGAADGLTFGLLAHCYSMTEQSVAAEGAYRQAMMLQPDVNDWKLGLMRCLFKQRKFDEAAAHCGDMLRHEPSRVDLWLLQANAFLALKQPLRAAEIYELLDRAGKANASCLNTLDAGRYLCQRRRAGTGGKRLPACAGRDGCRCRRLSLTCSCCRGWKTSGAVRTWN